ncbi:MAG: protein-L-isoaspartate(D-aspartate) O-methyltransferase [Bacteroidales bacterium]|nr:protein-L-isoaspartate(D-aspartate) O-methyltransferase [Bacteroidales bacterium]
MRLAVVIICIIMWENIFPQIDKYYAARNNMVKTQIIDRGITDAATLNALSKVPRHLFVPKENMNNAYADCPLPIGYGQTISQPYIVAYMTEVVNPSKKKKVLEIGTGSGYQAAILAEITDTVYTIEIVPELAKESTERLRQMGYNNIVVKSGDGYNGWPEHAPFDIIVVTAAVTDIPKPLTDQLSENGRLVIPVGGVSEVQELMLLVKKNGKIKKSILTYVRFVPFIRSKK